MADIELGSIEIKTGANTSDKFKLPYNVLADPPDLSVYAKLAGGNVFSGTQVITGYLDIRGTAADKHLKTRGIGGSDGNGNSSDLYLQYSSDYKTIFGKAGNSSLNADGSITIGGKQAATVDQIPSVPTNYVTTDTEQTITGAKVFKRVDVGADDAGAGFYVSQGANSDGDTLFMVNLDGVDIDPDSHDIPLLIQSDAGKAGQVVSSQGNGKAPKWASPAIKSATLSGTTLYLTLS